MINIKQKYIQNILYMLGSLAIAAIYFCMYYWNSLNTILFTSNVSVTNIVLLSELIVKNAWIWLISAVIIDKLLKQKFFYSVGLNLDRFAIRDILYGTILALLGLAIIFVFIYLITDSPTMHLNFNSRQLWIIHNLWTVNDATVEELIFRGFIFQNIFRKNNSIIAILVSSFLFAVVHFLYANWNLIFFINIFLAGILFCQMYANTKSLWSSIAFHAVWNVVIFNAKIGNTNEYTNIEFEYITALVLTLMIILVSLTYKPSYKINRHFLLHT